MEEKLNKDVAKELLMILSYCDNTFINNIPDSFFIKLNKLASTSTKEYYFDKDKSLLEQNISDDTKDMLSLLFYMYGSDNKTKDDIFNHWCINEQD